MIEAVAHEGRMRELQDGGKPARVHMENLVRQGRKTQDELDGPPVPDALEYLYRWLMELDRARDFGMSGPKLFTYPQVESWARLTGRDPEPHEVEALMHLGTVLLHPPPVEQET